MESPKASTRYSMIYHQGTLFKKRSRPIKPFEVYVKGIVIISKGNKKAEINQPKRNDNNQK